MVKVLCGDDDTHWAYFEKWIAQMIQQPGNINDISVYVCVWRERESARERDICERV